MTALLVLLAALGLLVQSFGRDVAWLWRRRPGAAYRPSDVVVATRVRPLRAGPLVPALDRGVELNPTKKKLPAPSPRLSCRCADPGEPLCQILPDAARATNHQAEPAIVNPPDPTSPDAEAVTRRPVRRRPCRQAKRKARVRVRRTTDMLARVVTVLASSSSSSPSPSLTDPSRLAPVRPCGFHWRRSSSRPWCSHFLRAGRAGWSRVARSGPRPAGPREDRSTWASSRSGAAVQPGVRLVPAAAFAFLTASIGRPGAIAMAVGVVLLLLALLVPHDAVGPAPVPLAGPARYRRPPASSRRSGRLGRLRPVRDADRPGRAGRRHPPPPSSTTRLGKYAQSITTGRRSPPRSLVDRVPRHARRPAADRAARQGRHLHLRGELRPRRGRGPGFAAAGRRRCSTPAPAARAAGFASRSGFLTSPTSGGRQLAGPLHPAVRPVDRQPAALPQPGRQRPAHPDGAFAGPAGARSA